MIFAAVLAGGVGKRMGNPDRPKQYLMLGDKPVIVHTVEKFCVSGKFDKVLLLCPQVWMQQTQDMVARFLPQFSDLLVVLPGGEVRNDTIMNAISYIQQTDALDEQTILVTHDAVRPFVSHRMIAENIAAALEHGACDTVVPATDTIVESLEGQRIDQIPNRANFYQGQTPQTFRALEFKQLYEALSDQQKQTLTDACKVFVLAGREVALVRGDVSNIKITYPHDMRVARAMLDEAQVSEDDDV